MLPVEVELALQVLPCQAMHRAYSEGGQPHACAHFAEWGKFHSYDYKDDGAPTVPGIIHPVIYGGKRPTVPEILSGCRKAPILAVGINPNLPGWYPTQRNAIHPYFDDYLQYAHYFRWRAMDKMRIPLDEYRQLAGNGQDGPFESKPLKPVGEEIGAELSPVTMYGAYQSLLDGLAQSQGWAGHKLSVGEDLAYANMVACASARWTIRSHRDMPVMGPARAGAIVDECFNKRQYFLRQMLQSLPAVVIVFSQTSADAFIAAMRGRFTLGDPQPQERIAELIKREIRLSFGRAQDGSMLQARVIFSPHASSSPEEFEEQRAVIVAHLADEVVQGRLELNVATGYLARTRGGCQFCDNALYSIGPCGYLAELRPLANAEPDVLYVAGRQDVRNERSEHERLLHEFIGASRADVGSLGAFEPLDAAAASAPKLVLLGEVVTMAGPPIRHGAVYLDRGVIVAVQERDVAPPEQFEAAPRIQTEGVIYPGLADLHNHLIYNLFTLWWPPSARSNRSQWLRDPDYKRRVSKPMETIAARQDLLCAAIRYVETKLILGGVTSGQGMHSQFDGAPNFRGLVRNFEQPGDPALRAIRHKIRDLVTKEVDSFKKISIAEIPFSSTSPKAQTPRRVSNSPCCRNWGSWRLTWWASTA